MNIFSGFADVSLLQLALVAGVALFASVVGGVSGYGTGALMPLVLVPLVGAEPVVPIIAISALFNNTSRLAAFLKYADFRRAGIVLACAVPTCVLGAWGYTRLSSAGAALVIGAMLILSVPLRRHLKNAILRSATAAWRSRGRLRRGGRRHRGLGRDPAVAADGGGASKAPA